MSATTPKAEDFQRKRQDAGLTQKQLAELLGLTPRMIQMMETGAKPIRTITWFALVHILDCGKPIRPVDGWTPAMFAKKREAAGMTQDALSKRLDVDLRTVQKWEGGENPIRRVTWLALAHVTQCQK